MAKKKILFKSFNKRHLLWIIPGGLISLFIIATIILPEPQYTDGFRTLNEIKAYADGLNEWVEMENDKVFYPTYNHYYQKKFKSSLLTKTAQKLKYFLNKHSIVRPSVASFISFEELLCNVTKQRNNEKSSKNFIQKIDASTFTQLIVFGPLYGAFQSLARCLDKLMEINVIDNNLKLNNKNIALVFLGNGFTKSPFCLETLTLVLKLIQNNPDQIIYIKGRQEMENQWKLQSLHKELTFAFPDEKNHQNNIEKEIDAFFDTLPLAMYYTFPQNNETYYLKFLYAPIKEEILDWDDKILPKDARTFLLKKQAESIVNFKLTTDAPLLNEATDPSPKLKAIISGILERKDIPNSSGLTILAPIHGIARWRIVSCPTPQSRKIFNCFDDAFIIISMTESQDQQIVHYYRDIRSTEKNFHKKSYHLVPSQQTTIE